VAKYDHSSNVSGHTDGSIFEEQIEIISTTYLDNHNGQNVRSTASMIRPRSREVRQTQDRLDKELVRKRRGNGEEIKI
jgi:hypothetical protein